MAGLAAQDTATDSKEKNTVQNSLFCLNRKYTFLTFKGSRA